MAIHIVFPDIIVIHVSASGIASDGDDAYEYQYTPTGTPAAFAFA